MIIQWFPGHMTKALRMMEKEVENVDVIIYVVDSRAPFSCVNPKFTELINKKPIIYAFNKYDLADTNKVNDWINKYFLKENTRCITLNSTESNSAKKIELEVKSLLSSKIEKFKNKGIKVILRCIVIGVPNCGKSTLINNLCGKAKVVTGNKPGVTKGKQWVTLASGIEVLDTPGTLWPSFVNNMVAKNLAYIGSIREEVLDIPDLSIEFIKDIRKIDKTILEKRYNIEINEEDENLEVLEKICQARNMLLRGGDFDYDRCSLMLINEFKQGKLGKITLESFKDLRRLTTNDKAKEEKKKND